MPNKRAAWLPFHYASMASYLHVAVTVFRLTVSWRPCMSFLRNKWLSRWLMFSNGTIFLLGIVMSKDKQGAFNIVTSNLHRRTSGFVRATARGRHSSSMEDPQTNEISPGTSPYIRKEKLESLLCRLFGQGLDFKILVRLLLS